MLDFDHKFSQRNCLCHNRAQNNCRLSSSIVGYHTTIHENHKARCRTKRVFASLHPAKSLSDCIVISLHTTQSAVDLVHEVESQLSCIEFRVRLFPSISEVHVLLLEDASLLVCEGTSTETLLQNLSLDVSTDINAAEIRHCSIFAL